MATKEDLTTWVLEALKALGGSAHHVEVAKHVWRSHENELRASGDLFYTWQYDLRWAAQRLRDSGDLKPDATTDRGTWALR